MSLKLTFPYKDKSAIDDMLRIDEIKDLAERDFKHWGNTPFFIARTYSNRVYPRKNSEKYQLIFDVSIIAMLRKKHLTSLSLMKAKKEKT